MSSSLDKPLTVTNANELDEEAIQRVMRLMEIPGGSCHEAKVAQAIVEELTAAGIDESQMFFDDANSRTRNGGEIGNLFLRLPGTIPGPTRMLSAHLDTVPICVGCKPVRDGELIRSADEATGLGADNRSGVAVLLNTALSLHRNKLPHPPLLFCWFVQEEIGLEGSHHLNPEAVQGVEWACNFDGGSPHRLTIGATTGQRIEINIRGRAAHAGVSPQDGISAIVIAAKAISQLNENGWLGKISKSDGEGTANVGVIQGGDATNVVTPLVTLRAEARSHNTAFCHQIADAIAEAFKSAAAETTNAAGMCGSVTIGRRVDYEAFRLADDASVVQILTAAVSAIGRQAELNVSNGGLDANWLVQHGVPTITIGCGQRNIHTADETLDIADYLAANKIALLIAQQGAA